MKTKLTRLFLTRPLFFINLGILIAAIFICLLKPPHLKDITYKTEITVNGTVDFITETTSSKMVTLKNIDAVSGSYNIDIGDNIRIYIDKEKSVIPGNQIRATGEFIPNSLKRNPGGFNSLNYYYSKDQTGYMFASDLEITSKHIDYFKFLTYKVRTHLTRIVEVIYPKEEAGIIKGIMLGDRSSMESSIKNLYRDNGIMHILAISALHLTFIGMAFYRGLMKVGFHLGPATIVTVALLYFYITMCGMSVSMIRALIMLVIHLIATYLAVPYDRLTCISVAWAIILIENPYKLYDSAFVLSFMAILMIGVVVPYSLQSKYMQSISFQLTMIPITVKNYFIYPLYSVVSNMLVLPFFGTLLILGFFSVFTFSIDLNLSYMISQCCNFILNYYKQVCTLLKSLPFSQLAVGELKGIIWIFYMMLIGIYLIYSRIISLRISEICEIEKHMTVVKDW